MGTYDAQAATAARLIARKGGRVTLERAGSRDGIDPVTQLGGAGKRSWTFRAVGLAPAGAKRLGVDLAGRNAMELYFALAGGPKDEAGAAVLPEPGDVVVVGTERLVLFWAQTLDPAFDGPVVTIAFAERK